MSSRIDPSLYPRLHEQLADRFGTVVFKLLPDIADALLAHAAEGLDANVAAKLTDTARLLREEAAVRAEIALENFVGIDLGSMSEESSLPVTVTDLGQPVAGADIGLLEQILARELASTVRSSFGGSYLNYLRRLESLAETPLRDDQHPLGARALALALIDQPQGQQRQAQPGRRNQSSHGASLPAGASPLPAGVVLAAAGGTSLPAGITFVPNGAAPAPEGAARTLASTGDATGPISSSRSSGMPCFRMR